MTFEEALAQYRQLRQAYDNRQLSGEDYGRRVQQLQVRDANGAYWAIDGATGGWLRYDGTSWVPGQPPIPPPAQSQPPAGGYGTPPPTYGHQPQPGYGQPQSAQGGYTPGPQPQPAQAQAAYGQPSPAPYAQPRQRGGRRGLLIGLIVGAVVLLALCLVGVGALVATGRAGGLGIGGKPGITEVATARTITDKKRPDQKETNFSVNSTMYITYRVSQVKKGDIVDLRLFRDGKPVELLNNSGKMTFDKDYSLLDVAISYQPPSPGAYRVDLVYNNESTPSQSLTFTVR